MPPVSPLRPLSADATGVSEALPERVLQFGTGALLRGLPDAFIDDANRTGQFEGGVVMVGSTGSGRAEALARQDGLYTLCVRGLREGQRLDEAHVVSSISRVLSASSDWDAVLDVARSPDLQIIISNTTEIGIADDPDDRRDLHPPRSFPGKLTAVLAQRAESLGYEGGALIVLPCELIESNGDHLAALVRRHAERWALGAPFLDWLGRNVTFANTLVDRIVPGTPEDSSELYERLGYTDALLTVAEPYRLWAIEGDAALAARLPLAGLEGVVVTDDLTPYQERKVRILNGGHTATVPAALLCGLETVGEAVADVVVGRFVRRVVLDEIVPSLDLDAALATTFAHEVLERFANPFIRHELLSITFQQTAKLRVRVAPSVIGFVAKRGTPPPLLAFGVAAFLATTRPGVLPATRPADDADGTWKALWADVDPADAVALRRFSREALATLFASDLAAVDEFGDLVSDALVAIERDGCRVALQDHLSRFDR